MTTAHIVRRFESIGARVRVEPPSPRLGVGSVTIDIGTDRGGEFFRLRPNVDSPDLLVLDAQPRDRHLLLMARDDDAKSKFLCGHDERHWFVAGVPETAPVGTVSQAMTALQPPRVQTAVRNKKVGRKRRNRRKNAAFVRQGEWFFLPAPDLVVPAGQIIRNEPLRRGVRGKPHWVDECFRIGGEVVYLPRRTARRHGGTGTLTQVQFDRLVQKEGELVRGRYRAMRRNMTVYVRGRVRHADHATITLVGWHEVVMNTENQSRAMRSVEFYD